MTGGRVGGRFMLVGRQRIALVDHVGARSGIRRTAALICIMVTLAAILSAALATQPVIVQAM